METGPALLSLILELLVKSVVYHIALVDGQLSCHVDKVTHSLVEIGELRNLHFLQYQLLEVIKLCAKLKIVFGHHNGGSLDSFALCSNVPIDSLVWDVEVLEVFCKLLGHIRGLTQNLSSKCLNLLYLLWPHFLILNREIVSELVLILFLKEVTQEFASS